MAGTLPQPTAAEIAKDEATQAAMSSALRRITDEGKTRLAQATTTAPRATLSDVPAGSGNPNPQAIAPAPLTPPKNKKEQHIIIKADSSIFDGPNSIMVAVGNVDVQHPDFHLTCEELELHMKKEKKAQDAAPAAGGQLGAGSLEKAIARGPKVVIQKQGDDGKIMTGQCRLLTFDGTTQVTVLRIWPQVSDGKSTQVSDDESTVMTISPQGVLNTRGPHHTDIIQAEQPRPKAEPSAPAAAPGTPSAPPAQ
jgi:lipopolysaccharide export system protein LptA